MTSTEMLLMDVNNGITAYIHELDNLISLRIQ